MFLLLLCAQSLLGVGTQEVSKLTPKINKESTRQIPAPTLSFLQISFPKILVTQFSWKLPNHTNSMRVKCKCNFMEKLLEFTCTQLQKRNH